MPDMSEIIRQLEEQRNRIDSAITALKSLGTTTTTRTNPTQAGTPRRKMSVAGRRRIAAAQRARWAKVKRQK